ncbi:extracellular solute-binding protein [Halobaculum sp. D14]|uniref:extracellular solute-binding protein n=1 Tax=Halobaculum sp. D14 TaxID=3421642 RepID=UPI003EBEC7D1
MVHDRRQVVKQIGSIAAVGTLAGCVNVSSGGDQTPTGSSDDAGDSSTPTDTGAKASLWHARSEGPQETLKSNVATYEESSPNTVALSKISDLEKKTTATIPAGNGPHTFDWAHDWVGRYSENGFLSDQSGSLDITPSEEYTGTAVDAVKYKGGLYGLPYAAETVGLVYNTDLVDGAPKTLDEMEQVMKDHHDPANGKYGLSYPMNPYFCSAWVHALGGFYYDEENDELGLTNDSTVEAFELIRDRLYKYSPDSVKYNAQAAAFADGNAPFAINGPWFVGTVKGNVPVGVDGFPTVGGDAPAPFTGVKMLYFTTRMGSDPEAATAARDFAQWYTTNTSVLKGLANDHGYVPVHTSLTGSDDLPATVKGYSKAVQQGTPTPTAPKMADVWDPVKSAIQSIMTGNKDVKPALETATEQITSAWE